MIIQIKAYEASDGKYFKDIDQAMAHEEKFQANKKRNKILSKKSKNIRKRIMSEYGIMLSNVSEPWHEGDDGWDCKDKNNPIDKCVYIGIYHEDEYAADEDCCIFCGQPEERK